MKIILNFSTSFQKLVRETLKVMIFCLYFSMMEMISFNFYEHIVKENFACGSYYLTFVLRRKAIQSSNDVRNMDLVQDTAIN